MTENDTDDDTYRAECPHCGENTAFTVGGRFGNLSCDSCEYTPRRKVRYEIRDEEMP